MGLAIENPRASRVVCALTSASSKQFRYGCSPSRSFDPSGELPHHYQDDLHLALRQAQASQEISRDVSSEVGLARLRVQDGSE